MSVRLSSANVVKSVYVQHRLAHQKRENIVTVPEAIIDAKCYTICYSLLSGACQAADCSQLLANRWGARTGCRSPAFLVRMMRQRDFRVLVSDTCFGRHTREGSSRSRKT